MTRLDISVEHAINIFLHNLKPELSHAVKVGNPCTLPQAYYLARLHEASFAAQNKAIKALSTGTLGIGVKAQTCSPETMLLYQGNLL